MSKQTPAVTSRIPGFYRERIETLRQAYNVREGLTPKDFDMPGRSIGNPPRQRPCPSSRARPSTIRDVQDGEKVS